MELSIISVSPRASIAPTQHCNSTEWGSFPSCSLHKPFSPHSAAQNSNQRTSTHLEQLSAALHPAQPWLCSRHLWHSTAVVEQHGGPRGVGEPPTYTTPLDHGPESSPASWWTWSWKADPGLTKLSLPVRREEHPFTHWLLTV